LPGYGDAAKNLAEARGIMAALGHGAGNPLKVTVSTRANEIYIDGAVFVVSQLKEVYLEPTLEQVDTGVWFGRLARRDFSLAWNLTAVGAGDPDANFFENYLCGSERNYSDYCNEDLQKLIYAQSAERDPGKRLALVHEIDKRLQRDVARPILSHREDFFALWPYVKNLVVHPSIYNFGRMQEVWLDR
jgi:peptide/nickel transport system substrate-binding protein